MLSFQQIQDFITVALAISIEALPFVVLGVLIATVVQYAVSLPRLLARLPRNPFLRRLTLASIGVLFPVCECGNVPVARTLLVAGLRPHEVVTFLLAAPILNPVVFLTTREAFARVFPEMVWVRMAAGLAIALLVGSLLSFKKDQDALLQSTFYRQVCEGITPTKGGAFARAVVFFQAEFLTIMKSVVIGSAIASAIQSFVPREAIVAIGSSGALSIVAMTALAFVVSICSSVDAFFALAFASTMPFGAILAFLVFGPMMDIKMFTLLRSTFKTRYITYFTVVLAVLTSVIGLSANAFFS